VAAAAHERQPGVAVDVQAVEDGREIGGDGSAFVAAHDAAGLVHQRQIFVQRDGGGEGAVVGLVDGGADDGRNPQVGFRRCRFRGQGGDEVRGAVRCAWRAAQRSCTLVKSEGSPRLRAAVRPGARVRARSARRDLGRRQGDDPVWIGQNNDVQVV